MLTIRLLLLAVGLSSVLTEAQISVRCLRGYSPIIFEWAANPVQTSNLDFKIYQRTHSIFGQNFSEKSGFLMAQTSFDSLQSREKFFEDALKQTVSAGSMDDPAKAYPGVIELDLSGPEKRLSFHGKWNYAGGSTGNFHIKIHGTTGHYSVNQINLIRNEDTQLRQCEWVSGPATMGTSIPENDDIDNFLLKMANSRSSAVAGQILIHLLKAYPDLDLVQIQTRLLSLDAGFYLMATQSVPSGLCISPTIKDKKVAQYRLQFNWGEQTYIEGQLRSEGFASEEENLKALRQTGLLHAKCQDL